MEVVVGDHRVAPGKRARIDLPVARLPTGTDLALPVAVVNGRRDGPRVFLSAAVHGDEVGGVEVIRRVLASVDPKSLSGYLLAVPILNVFGFVTGSRYLPDRRDLNRSFPGSKRGSLAARLANLFMEEVVDGADAGIDLHTGSDHRFNMPQIRANLDDPRTAKLARAFGAPLCLHATERDGSLRQACSAQGIPLLLFEGGEAHRFDERVVETASAGIRRVLAHLGMIEGVSDAEAEPVVSRSSRWVRARRSGIYRSDIRDGDSVSDGQVLGHIADAFGKTVARVRAPVDGVVIGFNRNPLVSQGDALIHIAQVEEAPLS